MFQILGARHLVKSGRGIASPFVQIEVCGCACDYSTKYKTKTYSEYVFISIVVSYTNVKNKYVMPKL